MVKNDCFHLGHITKPFGIKGEVVLFLDVDIPEKYVDLKSIFLELENDLKEFEVESLRLKNNLAFLKIKDINKIEETEKILKKEVYLPLTLLPALGDKNFYLHEIIGFSVTDSTHGPIGKIKTVVEMPAQRLLEINNARGEILIPIKPEFIDRVDRSSNTLYINAPEGLIDIYLNPKQDED